MFAEKVVMASSSMEDDGKAYGIRNGNGIDNHNDNDNHNDKGHDGSARSCIFQIGVSAGRLCGVANSPRGLPTGGRSLPSSFTDERKDIIHHPYDDNYNRNNHNNNHKNDTGRTKDRPCHALVLAMTELLLDVYRTCRILNVPWSVSIRKKLALNGRKYPIELCKGKAGKYTQYSQVTGVTVDNQSLRFIDDDDDDNNNNDENDDDHPPIVTSSWQDLMQQLPKLVEEIRAFAEDRDWSQFHTPRNLVLALLGEVGELAELVQWKGDPPSCSQHPTSRDKDGVENDADTTTTTTTREMFSSTELDKLSQELADVSIYLLRLVSVTNVTSEVMEQLDWHLTTTMTTMTMTNNHNNNNNDDDKHRVD